MSITGSGVSNGRLSMPAATWRHLGYKVSPSNAVVGAMYWSSSDTSVATVDGTAKVTAKSGGMAVITVTVGGKNALVMVTVQAAVDAGDSLSVRRGRDMHLRNSLAPGVAERVFDYGYATDMILFSNWDGK